jgi:hypothetical protein
VELLPVPQLLRQQRLYLGVKLLRVVRSEDEVEVIL